MSRLKNFELGRRCMGLPLIFFGPKAKKNTGFTLMELVVVLGISTILIVTIVNVFLLALRAQRQASLRQEAVANLRFAIETIARQIRTSQIDYGTGSDGKYDADQVLDGLPGIIGAEQELYLIDPNSREVAYFLEAGTLKTAIDGQVSDLTDGNRIIVTNLSFYISPVASPFAQERCDGFFEPDGCLLDNQLSPNACTVTSNQEPFEPSGFCRCIRDADCATKHCDIDEGLCLPFDIQPTVTMVLEFESVGIRPTEQQRVNLQTTVASRIYRR